MAGGCWDRPQREKLRPIYYIHILYTYTIYFVSRVKMRIYSKWSLDRKLLGGFKQRCKKVHSDFHVRFKNGMNQKIT